MVWLIYCMKQKWKLPPVSTASTRAMASTASTPSPVQPPWLATLTWQQVINIQMPHLSRLFSNRDWFFNLRSSVDKRSLCVRYVTVLYSSILGRRKAAEDLMKTSVKTWETRQTKEWTEELKRKKVADGSQLSGLAPAKPTGLKMMLKRQESQKHNLLWFGLFNLYAQGTGQFTFHAEVLPKNYHGWITCWK